MYLLYFENINILLLIVPLELILDLELRCCEGIEKNPPSVLGVLDMATFLFM